MQLAEQILRIEEGFRDKPYNCSEGYPTVGFGRVIGKKGDQLTNITVTLPDEVQHLRRRIATIDRMIPEIITQLDDVRAAVIVSMAYQIGVVGLRKFRFFLQAVKEENWQLASDHMLDSRWAKQTPARAERHAEMMLTGKLLKYYD